MDTTFAEAVSREWPDTCTIQRETVTQEEGGSGEETPTWTNLTGHIALPCIMGSAGGSEEHVAQLTLGVQMFHILLAGFYPTILQKDRAVVCGVAYDIILPEPGSEDGVTRLTVKRVT